MERTIICISRQYGSGGREIGEAVAKKLGIPCYDKCLIQKAAQEAGLSEAAVAEYDPDTPAAPDGAQTGITVDRERHTVLCDGREITLPRKEFALLELLCAAPGRLVSREEIYARIWGSEVVVGDRTIDVHIRKLRQKIGERRIVTVKGMGYKYEPGKPSPEAPRQYPARAVPKPLPGTVSAPRSRSRAASDSPTPRPFRQNSRKIRQAS